MASGSARLALVFALLAVGRVAGDPAAAARAVDPARLRATIDSFSRDGGRVTGSAGAERAAARIERAFRDAGLVLQRQRFDVPMPRMGDAVLTVGGVSVPLEPLCPNLVRLSATPAGGVSGPLVRGGDGSLANYAGQDVDGAVVLLDFDCGQRWLDAATLGARAVVFVETDRLERGEAQRKFLKVPLDLPRYYLTRAAAARLPRTGTATLHCAGDWVAAEAVNLLGLLPGSDPALRGEVVVVTAYYDSMSVVPSLAPGAEQAGGISTLLEAVRVLSAARPKRSVLFCALAAHHQALAGARALAWTLRRDHIRERWDDALRLMRRADERELRELEADLAEAPRKGHRAEQDAAWRAALRERIERRRFDRAFADALYAVGEPVLTVSLDLSSGSDQVGAFHAGHFYRNDKLTRFLSPMGKRFVAYGEQAGLPGAVVDCINPLQDQGWDTWVPDQFATDAEPLVEAARPAVCLFTIRDSRPRVDTPADTPERLHWPNLERQARAVVGALSAMVDDPGLKTEGLKRVKRLPYRFTPIDGPVYEFERRKSFLPDTPVPGAVVALKDPIGCMMGVRPEILSLADARGEYRILGYDDLDLTLKIDGYAFEPGTGRITYAPDLGPEGEVKYPREARGRQGLKRPLILFPCHPVNLFDLVDERYFETLEQIYVFDARTDSEPRSYGYDIPVHSPPTVLAGTMSASYVEPVAVVYAPRETPVKIAMAMGLLGLRFILTEATPAEPTGVGFDPAVVDRVPRTPYRAARDMWLIDEARMAEQRRYGVQNRRLAALHARAEERLAAAEQALAARDWQAHLAAAREAWALEARAYPDVQRTKDDVVKGVLFYLGLLLPFAFFTERLLIASPRIKGQITGTLTIFGLVYFCLHLVHPAFRLLDAPWIILLGFIIMALALLVIAVVARRFNEELETLKQAAGGTHSADVSRSGTLGAAFGLGISNMRRRPLRTALTGITLTLLTFTVLSFTSVGTTLRANAVATRGSAVYPGILIRDAVWGALEAPTAAILANQFRDDGLVVPRAWLTSAALDKQMKLSARNGTAQFVVEQAEAGDAGTSLISRLSAAVRRAGRGQAARRWAAGYPAPDETLLLQAVLGLTPDEPRVSGLGGELVAGRWFAPGEQDVCVVPQAVAERLGLGPGTPQARAGHGFGAVEVFGSRFEVIGIIGDGRLTSLRDLDGEPLTPVDFSQLEPEKLQMVRELATQKLKLGRAPVAPIDRYIHFPADVQLILPYERLMSLGGTLRSVAVRFDDAEAVAPAAAQLMERFEMSAYATDGERVMLHSSIGMTSVSGLQTVLIPMLIAALIVLNTMLGAVAERLHEIGIFSSIGLAPAHIGTLFLAESCVLANIGVILGYLLGQSVAKVLYSLQQSGRLGGLAGLSLNYSSTAAVGVACLIIAIVLLSTLYPSRRAAQLATPDIERRWRLPQPDGHTMTLPLPFMLTGRDGLACNLFLKEYFDAFVDFPGGDFYTDGTSFEPLSEGGYRLALTVWLAPYDLGVSQRVALETRPDPDDPQVQSVVIQIERLSGDDTGWRRTNWLFVNILRRQFLIWRTIAPAQKAAYADAGEALLAER